jgi:aspartate aminotransferase-like enzyme
MSRTLLFIPGPVTVAEPVLAALAQPLIDHRGPEFAELLGRASRELQPLFGTRSEVLLLGSSGTGGLEAAVATSFAPGDRVLACPVGVFGKRLAAIAKTYGLEVETLDTPAGAALDPARLAARLAADARHEFHGVLLTHNETSTGVQNDMAALSAAIGSHPATVIVDSVSGLGASPFEMDAWNFDIVVAASQKALAAPPGLAMVAVSARAWERMRGPHCFYFDLRKARAFAADGETPWTPPVSIVLALDVALARYRAEGAERAFARHAGYAAAIRLFAEGLGLEVFSRPDAHSVTVVALRAPAGIDVAALRGSLLNDYGIALGGGQAELKGKLLRIGTMGDVSPADVLRALESLEAVLARSGYTAPERGALDAARARLSEDLLAARS